MFRQERIVLRLVTTFSATSVDYVFFICSLIAMMYSYLTLSRYQQCEESTLDLWAIFLLCSRFTVQYEGVRSVKKGGTGDNFQRIHNAATRVVQPKAKWNFTKLPRKLRSSYWIDHDLYKNLFQRASYPFTATRKFEYKLPWYKTFRVWDSMVTSSFLFKLCQYP